MVIADRVEEHLQAATKQFMGTIDNGCDTVDFVSSTELNDQACGKFDLTRAFAEACRDAANGHINHAIEIWRICKGPVYALQNSAGGEVLGVFAIDKIPKGTVLGAYLAEYVLEDDEPVDDESDQGPKTRKSYEFALSRPGDLPQMVVECTRCGNEMIFINDYRNICTSPNANYINVVINGCPVILVVTCADIDTNEQVLADYGDAFWQQHASANNPLGQQSLLPRQLDMKPEEPEEGGHFEVEGNKSLEEKTYGPASAQGQEGGAAARDTVGHRRYQRVPRAIAQHSKGKALVVEEEEAVEEDGTMEGSANGHTKVIGHAHLGARDTETSLAGGTSKELQSQVWCGGEHTKGYQWSGEQPALRSKCIGSPLPSTLMNADSTNAVSALSTSRKMCSPGSPSSPCSSAAKCTPTLVAREHVDKTQEHNTEQEVYAQVSGAAASVNGEQGNGAHAVVRSDVIDLTEDSDDEPVSCKMKLNFAVAENSISAPRAAPGMANLPAGGKRKLDAQRTSLKSSKKQHPGRTHTAACSRAD